jgi:hypothetical protein
MVIDCRKRLSLPCEFMQTIVGGEIAYTFWRSDLGVDRTAQSDHVLFRFPAISQFGYVPDDLLFVCPLSRGIFIPPENLNVWNSFAFELKETSLLKSAHTVSFALSICRPLCLRSSRQRRIRFDNWKRMRPSLGRFHSSRLLGPFGLR